jgi:D-sedoheptulose 7-phosphate isomerase
MRQDPRHLNVTLDASSIDSYKKEYARGLQAALTEVSSTAVEQLCDAILKCTDNGRQILVVGNGGSAAIAEHLCCDWTKGTACEGHPIITSRSLTANSSLYSAIANDYGFESVFDTQIDFFGKDGDVLIAISSSGNSPNILKAAKRAKALGMLVAGFTGFKGGELKELADISIHVPISNYGIVEDGHQSVMHVIAQFIACKRDAARAA